MGSTLSRGVHLAAAVTVGLLAVPIFGALVWGVWRLLFWGVVGASPPVRGVNPGGIPVTGPMPPGGESLLISDGFSALPIVLPVFVALAVAIWVAMSLASSRGHRDEDAREGPL